MSKQWLNQLSLTEVDNEHEKHIKNSLSNFAYR